MKFDKDRTFSLTSLMKLEHGFSIPVLTSLSGDKLWELKNKAVFDLKFNKENGSNDSAVTLYINSWLEDEKASCPSTWNNLLVLLNDMKLGEITKKIIKIVSPDATPSDFSINPGNIIYIVKSSSEMQKSHL